MIAEHERITRPPQVIYQTNSDVSLYKSKLFEWSVGIISAITWLPLIKMITEAPLETVVI